MQTMKSSFVIMTLFTISCSEQYNTTAESLVDTGVSRLNQNASAQAQQSDTAPDIIEINPVTALTMDYDFTVTFFEDLLNPDGTENPLCSGVLNLEFLSDFSPSGQLNLNCGGIDISNLINLPGILNALGGMGIGLEEVVYDDGTLRLGRFLGATYTPARPVFIKPFFPDSTFYQGFNRVLNTTITATNAFGVVESADGNFNITMVDMISSFEVTGLGPLNEVSHFTVNATGFDGISPLDGFNFKLMEIWFEDDPLALPAVKIGFDTSDIIAFSLPFFPSEVIISGELTNQQSVAPFDLK